MEAGGIIFCDPGEYLATIRVFSRETLCIKGERLLNVLKMGIETLEKGWLLW